MRITKKFLLLEVLASLPPGKGFEKIITLVQNEFKEAKIKLNIPFARFGDNDGSQARKIAEQCRKTFI